MRMDVNFRETEDTFGVELDEGSENLPVRFGEAQTVTERDYNALNNKPSINNVELVGNKSAEDLELADSADALDIATKQIVSITADTKRVDNSTQIINPLWLDRACAQYGYSYDPGANRIYFYTLFCYEGNYNAYALLDKNSPNDPYEFTYENAPTVSKLTITLPHAGNRTRMTPPSNPGTVDIRFCLIAVDNEGNEIERLYSSQYRYTLSGTTITRVETPTTQTSSDYIADLGVTANLSSLENSFNGITYELQPHALTTGYTGNAMQFMIPDALFEGADNGLKIVAKRGDGAWYKLANVYKAESPPYYTKPENGIPATDLAEGVNTSLGKADSAYQLPAGGIPATDLADKYAGAAVAGGVADGTQSIPYGEVDSTSTATVFTATVPGITALKHGTIVLLKNGVITSASGFTVNINGLGAKPVYSSMSAAAAETTLFNVNYTLLLIYDEVRVTGGCWLNYRGYNSDTNTIGYQIRSNNTVLKTTDKNRYYKIFFTSQDGTHWVPATADSTNSATSAKTVNQKKIDPFGRIVYTSATTSYAAEADIAAGTIWTAITSP